MHKQNLPKRRELIIVLMGAVFGAIFSFFIQIYFSCQSERTLERSGAFDKPEIQVFLDGKRIDQDKESLLFIASQLTDSVTSIGKLPFVFENVGKKIIKDWNATFRFPVDPFDRLGLDSKQMNITGDTLVLKLKKTSGRIGVTDFVSYNVSNLNPGEAINIGEPIRLNETKQTRRRMYGDQVIKATAYYSLFFSLSVSGDEIPFQDYHFKLSISNKNDSLDLQRHLGFSLNQRAKKIRGTSSFFGYLFLLAKNTRESAFVIFPRMDTVITEKGTIFESGFNESRIISIEYDPVSLKFLWSGD